MSEENAGGQAGDAVVTDAAADAAAGGGQAPADGGDAGNAVEAGGKAEARWFDSFDDDTKTYLSSKGWDKEGKGPSDVLKSYRELEKMRGVDPNKTITLPDPENAEEVAAFKQRLGVPTDIGDYTSPSVSLGDDAIDTDVLAAFSHKFGHSQETHEAFVNDVAGLLICTASHNPPEWQGIKFNPRLGYPAPTTVTDFLAFHINELQLADADARTTDLDDARKRGRLHGFDPLDDYVAWIKDNGKGNARIPIDFDRIREFFSDKMVVIDEFHGFI